MPRRGDNIRKRTDGRWEGRYPVTSADGKKRFCLFTENLTGR